MGIGGSIFLLALGAILAFAVNAQFSGIDINVVGYVLTRSDGRVVEEYRTVHREDPPPPGYGS